MAVSVSVWRAHAVVLVGQLEHDVAVVVQQVALVAARALHTQQQSSSPHTSTGQTEQRAQRTFPVSHVLHSSAMRPLVFSLSFHAAPATDAVAVC